MNINTHPGIDAALCGYPLELAEGRSVTELLLTDVMKAVDFTINSEQDG